MAGYGAWVMRQAGSEWRWETHETPALRSGEARVRLRCAALNHRDLWMRLGAYPVNGLPCVPGSDGYGTVEAVGSSVDSTWVGRPVIVNPSLDWGGNDAVPGPGFKILGVPDAGTFAQSVCVPVAQLHPAPEGWSPEEAAALPLAGLTAHRALFRRGGLRAGEKVLLTGIGGGAAQFLLQFAVAAGAEVWVTSGSAEKISAAEKMGAQGGVLYTAPDWKKDLASVGGFDLCVDSAAGAGWAGICELLRPGGRLVFFGATRGAPQDIPMRTAFFKQLSFLGTAMGSPNDFRAMLAFVAEHKLRPVIDTVMPLEKIESAFLRMQESRQFGKIVFQVK